MKKKSILRLKPSLESSFILCAHSGCLTVFHGVGLTCPDHSGISVAPLTRRASSRREKIRDAVRKRLAADPPAAWLPMPTPRMARRLSLAEIEEYHFRCQEHQAALASEGIDYVKGWNRPGADAAERAWQVLKDAGLRHSWTDLCGQFPKPAQLDASELLNLEVVTKQAVMLALACVLRSEVEGPLLTLETIFARLAEKFSPWWRAATARVEGLNPVDATLETVEGTRRDLVREQVDVMRVYDLVTKEIPALLRAPYTATLAKASNGGYAITARDCPEFNELKKSLLRCFEAVRLRQSIALLPDLVPVPEPRIRARHCSEQPYNSVKVGTVGRRLLEIQSKTTLLFNVTGFLAGYEAADADKRAAAEGLSQYGIEVAKIPRLTFGPRKGIAWGRAKKHLGLGKEDRLSPTTRDAIAELLAKHDRAEKILTAFGQVETQVLDEAMRRDQGRTLLGLPITPYFKPIRSGFNRVLNQRWEPTHLWPVRVTPKLLRDDAGAPPPPSGGFDFVKGLRFNFFAAPGLEGEHTQPLVGVDVASSQYQILGILLNLPALEKVAGAGELWDHVTDQALHRNMMAPGAYSGESGRKALKNRLKKQATQVGYGATLARALRTLWQERDEYGAGFSSEGADALVPREEGEDDATYRRRLGKARARMALDHAEEYEREVMPDGDKLKRFREACKRMSQIACGVGDEPGLDPYAGIHFADPYDPEQTVRWNPVRRAPVARPIKVSLGDKGLLAVRPAGKWVTRPEKKAEIDAALDWIKNDAGVTSITRASKDHREKWEDERNAHWTDWYAFIPAAPDTVGDFPVDINKLRRELAPMLVHTCDALFSALVIEELDRQGVPVVGLHDSWLVPQRVQLRDGAVCDGEAVLRAAIKASGEAWLRRLGSIYDCLIEYLRHHEHDELDEDDVDWAAYAHELKDQWAQRVARCERGEESWPDFHVKTVGRDSQDSLTQ